jgi:hypothetical protein
MLATGVFLIIPEMLLLLLFKTLHNEHKLAMHLALSNIRSAKLMMLCKWPIGARPSRWFFGRRFCNVKQASSPCPGTKTGRVPGCGVGGEAAALRGRSP